MTNGVPIESTWDGEAFRPINPFWQRRADKQFARGEVLYLVDQGERSTRSHSHFFAAVEDAWANLPPLMAERFPSPHHLRRYALIKAGFCDSQTMPCGSKAEAQRMASFIKPLDEFSLVTVDGSLVHVFRAHSQSYRAMGKEAFQRSKDEVLRVIAEMIGVAKQKLTDSAGKAA